MSVIRAAGIWLLLVSSLSLPVRAQDSRQDAIPLSPSPLRLPPIVGPDDLSIPLVVIDPGHGGVDPGAISPTGTREKDLTLDLGRNLKAALVAAGLRVALTRDDDRFLVLQERYRIAEKLGAALLISLHMDSAGDKVPRGAAVYTLSAVASDKEVAKFSEGILGKSIAGIDLSLEDNQASDILFSMIQSETMMKSGRFADLIIDRIRPVMPVLPTGHRYASLIVLKSPEIPSVLLEAGYISNPQDSAWLELTSNRLRLATAVARAASDFLKP